jgi:hypothetical protein
MWVTRSVDPDPCGLLTPTQVSFGVGMSVGADEPISERTAPRRT